MLGRIVTRLVAGLLRGTRLSNENKQLLTGALLDQLRALPLHARISVDETGQVIVGGRALNLETAQRLRQSARAQKNNFARKFVGEQVTFMAVHMGVHENTSPEQGLFAKAALWVRQEEDRLYQLLAGSEQEQ